MTTRAMAFVRGAERMVTSAWLTPEGLRVRFADERDGLIPFEDLGFAAPPEGVTLPAPYLIEVRLANGSIEEVPWDFARHYADPGYRERSEAAVEHGARVFAERLRTLRNARGLTQEQLAELAGLNRVTIARYETAEHLPRYRTLVALAGALGVGPERLIGG